MEGEGRGNAVAWLYLNDGGVVLIRVGGIEIYRGSSVVRVRLC